jgi:23S rRNA A1618 N6-methylase RlmF
MSLTMKRPNFTLLAEKYPELKECSYRANTNSGTSEPFTALNWNLGRSQRSLTAITLKEAFQIDINLPPDRLCPPVPNRLSYIGWLSDLLALIPLSTECVIASPLDPLKQHDHASLTDHILDIGVGASCIYPLLGHQQHNWRYDLSVKACHSFTII